MDIRHWPLGLLLCSLPLLGLAAGKGLLDEDPEVVEKLPRIERYRAFLPPAVDLSEWFPPVGNQGSQGSCVGWAVGYGLRSYYARRYGEVPMDVSGRFSPSYVFNQIKVAEQGCEGGSRITDALTLLTKEGVAPYQSFPYSEQACENKPDLRAKAEASRYPIKSFRRVPKEKLDDIKGQLNQGNPVVFGMLVGKSFEDWTGSGVFRDASPAPDEGGHAMVLAGYDEQRRAFRLFNSWSGDWGDGGYAWVDYDAFAARARYAFVVEPVLASPVPPPAPVVVAVVVPPPPPKAPEPPPPPAPVTVVVTPEIVVIPPPAPAPEPPPPPLPVSPPTPAPLPVVVTPPLAPIEPIAPPPEPPPAPTVVVVAPPVPDVPTPPPTAPEPPPAPPVVVAVLEPPVPVVVPPAPPKPILQQLSEALEDLPCASVSVSGSASMPVLEGFVADDSALGEISTLLRDLSLTPARQRVAVRRWPQCEALQTFDTWLAPRKGKVDVSLIGAKTVEGVERLKNGDFLQFRIQTPSYPAHVYATYIPADGSAIQLLQPKLGARQPANSSVLIGADAKQRRFRIAPPLGDEMIIVFATKKPLFDKALPDFLEEREFLTRFRQALLNAELGADASAAITVLRTVE